MTKKEWKKVIEDQIKFDHEYIPSFQTTINVLCELLEERDRVYDMYVETGSKPVVIFTSDRGAENYKPNPLLKQWHELTVTVLSYLRDLGLTAAGLRKLQGTLPKYNGGEDKLEQFRQKIGLSDVAMNQIKPHIETMSTPDQIMTMIRAKQTSTTTTKKGTKKND